MKDLDIVLRVATRFAAGGLSVFAKLIDAQTKAMETELAKKASKYCGPGSKCQAKVEVSNGYLNASVWFDMGPDSTKSEAEELTQMFLGSEAVVGPHKLVPDMWVAVLKIRLG